FVTDATAADGVELEIILRDDSGAEIKRLKFPEPDANPWVRHRQRLLAQQLMGDMPVPQRGAEKVALKGTAVAQADYWLPAAAIRQLIEETKDKDGNVVPPPVLHPEAQKKLRAKLELFSHMTQPAADAPRLTLPGADAGAPRSAPVDVE